MPALTANKASSYANSIAEALWSDEKAVEAFKVAIEVVEEALGSTALNRDVVKTQAFTDAVTASALARVPKSSQPVAS